MLLVSAVVVMAHRLKALFLALDMKLQSVMILLMDVIDMSESVAVLMAVSIFLVVPSNDRPLWSKFMK